MLGSALFSSCLDRSSSRRAWIGVLLAVLGSAFQIGAVLGLEFQMEISDRRRAWIEVSNGNFRLAFEFQMEISTWIGVSDRRCAPCLDQNFKEFGIERSFREE